MATVLDLTALPEYIEQNRDELFIKSTLGAKSADYLDLMPNVKHKAAINFLDSEVVLQDGSECGWNPAGSDVFTQRFIEVAPIEVQKSWCWKAFREKYMNYQLAWEAGREKLPFEEKIAQSNMNMIQEAVESLIWNGDSGLSINGIIQVAEAESADTINVEFETGQTVSAKIDAIVAALPMNALKKGANVFLSYTDFRQYVAENNATCCAGRPIYDAASDSIKYLGDSRVTLVPVFGLEDTGAMFAFPKDAVILGTDVEGADNHYELWYSKDNDEFRFYVLWMFGIAFRFPGEVVYGK